MTAPRDSAVGSLSWFIEQAAGNRAAQHVPRFLNINVTLHLIPFEQLSAMTSHKNTFIDYSPVQFR